MTEAYLDGAGQSDDGRVPGESDRSLFRTVYEVALDAVPSPVADRRGGDRDALRRRIGTEEGVTRYRIRMQSVEWLSQSAMLT